MIKRTHFPFYEMRTKCVFFSTVDAYINALCLHGLQQSAQLAGENNPTWDRRYPKVPALLRSSLPHGVLDLKSPSYTMVP